MVAKSSRKGSQGRGMKRNTTSYDWHAKHPQVIAGKLYDPPAQSEVREYYASTGNPHPWRAWDVGSRFIAFNRKVNMKNAISEYIKKQEPRSAGIFAPVCRTIGCHAATARIIIPNYTKNYYLDYDYGRGILSCYLTGEDATDTLPTWARNHPELWGNYDGEFMFFDNASPFGGGQSKYVITSKRIGEHWQAVAECLVISENHKQAIKNYKEVCVNDT